MDGLKDYNAAKREAFEEAGIEGRISRMAFGAYDYLKRLKGGAMQPCRVIVYQLTVKAILRNWPEKNQRKRKWFSALRAAELVQEPELQILIKKFLPVE